MIPLKFSIVYYVIFFLVYIFIVYFALFNLIQLIVLEEFRINYIKLDNPIQMTYYQDTVSLFKNLWAKYTSELKLHKKYLVNFFLELEEPIGFGTSII